MTFTAQPPFIFIQLLRASGLHQRFPNSRFTVPSFQTANRVCSADSQNEFSKQRLSWNLSCSVVVWSRGVESECGVVGWSRNVESWGGVGVRSRSAESECSALVQSLGTESRCKVQRRLHRADLLQRFSVRICIFRFGFSTVTQQSVSESKMRCDFFCKSELLECV